MSRGQRHLVKCRCVLPQFKGRIDPPAHRFLVFSVINDDDTVIQKYAQCNNCGVIHKVVDICTSVIMSGKENMSSILTIDEVKTGLPVNLADILDRNGVDMTVWEQAKFILENKQWGNFIVLAQEEEGGTKQGKYVTIMSETFFKVESFMREDVATP
jgi:hypothetical protein